MTIIIILAYLTVGIIVARLILDDSDKNDAVEASLCVILFPFFLIGKTLKFFVTYKRRR